MRTTSSCAGVRSLLVVLLSVAILPVSSAVAVQPPPFVAEADRLAADATIYRDSYGVPHIFGRNEQATYFGFGYAQAEDHLQQMATSYRAAAGRKAEVLGEEFLTADYRARLFRFHDMASSGYAELDPRVKPMLEGFVAGVNYYIATHRGEIHAWIEPVSPPDVVALMKFFIHFHYQIDFQDLTGEIPQGSNGCVVGRGRSASGKAMLLADPHLPWSGVTRMYEAHLHCPGLNVSGATLFGLPVILVGHNDNIAWTFTGNRPEVADLFEERLNDKDPGLYLDGASWTRMELIPAVISVTGPAGGRAEPRTLVYTRHGPVVKMLGKSAYALSLSGWRDVHALIGWYLINKAGNIEEFKAALALQHIPVFNFLYADAGGNIYYVYNGNVPIKSGHYESRAAVPGWVRETQWRGIIPFDQLPQSENPASGFLLNCNNPPWFSTKGSDIFPARFPPYLSNDPVTFRAQRMMDLLANDTSVTLKELKEMPWDNYVLMAEQAKPLIAAAVRELGVAAPARAASLRRAAVAIDRWDNACDVDSAGVPLFYAWFSAYRDLFPGTSVADLTSRMGVPAAREKEAAVAALEQAVAFMLAEYGRLEVRWGDVQRLRRGSFEHEVGGAALLDPLNQIVGGELTDGISYAGGGHAFVMVAHMADPVEAFTVVPYGSSENPDSPHYADQMSLMARGKFKKAWFTEREIFSNLESAWGSDIVLRFPEEASSARVRMMRPGTVTAEMSGEAPSVPLPGGLNPLSEYFSVNGPSAVSGLKIKASLALQEGKRVALDSAALPPALYCLPTGAIDWQKCESQFDEKKGVVTGTGTQFGTYAVLGS